MKFFAYSAAKKAVHPLRPLTKWLNLSLLDIGLVALGDLTMAFALTNVHMPAQITEGGVLGLNILIQKTLGGSPAILAMILDFSLYFLGFLFLERGFLKKAVFSTVLFSVFYEMFFRIGPVLPSLVDMPFLAAVVGGLLLGAGCGLVVTRGTAAGGDDCYALLVEKYTNLSLSKAYVTSDATILFLSFLVYLPAQNVLWSFLTTLVSSFVIGQFEVHLPKPVLPFDPAELAAKGEAFAD